MRTVSVRTGLLVALALVAVASFASTSANAAFTAPWTVKCTGDSITGRGASFQNAAQLAFIEFWRTNTSAPSTAGCGPAASQTITYEPLGSGSGRAAFGAGAADRDPVVRYTAFDEAPTPTQRTQMEAAQGTTGLGKLAVAPIATGATTVISHFPRYCELPAGDPDLAPYARFKISNARLENAWTGDAANDEWGEMLPGIQAIPNNAGGKTTQQCQDEIIKRVVRFDSSGTTFSFKQFLGGIDGATGWAGAFAGTTWPNPANVLNGGAAGNGPLAAKVRATPGSIGYSDLATARDNAFKKVADNVAGLDPAQYKYDDGNFVAPYFTYTFTYSFNKRLFWIPLEQANAGGPTGSGVYSEPTNDPAAIRLNRKGANCAGVTYANVPLTAGGTPDVFGDWSLTNGTLALNKYPLCTITYVGFWDDYFDVYGNVGNEQAMARTVKDYITTSTFSGQNLLYANDYTPLPTDLRTASRAAIQGMQWNK
ncbi:MAG: substrate-binding domain-containing protein [Solirubrobacterales bacterium]